MRGETKIQAGHRARTAVIYVRQSTMAQVRDHTESTARQYALVDEASRLGWPASAIERCCTAHPSEAVSRSPTCRHASRSWLVKTVSTWRSAPPRRTTVGPRSARAD